MDYPSKRLKGKHRKERHNFECPDWAIKRYGDGAKNAVRLHIIQDHFRYIIFLGLPVMFPLRIIWLILKAICRILGKIFLRDYN